MPHTLEVTALRYSQYHMRFHCSYRSIQEKQKYPHIFIQTFVIRRITRVGKVLLSENTCYARWQFYNTWPVLATPSNAPKETVDQWIVESVSRGP
jgi:hypothetical protein